VKVVPPRAGVERANYLADARSVGANYYVTGFVTPLGNGASVVEQVVSTISGTLVFSVTNYITSLDDIANQGDQLRAGILERGNRALQAFQAPPPPDQTPAPEPSNGTETSINKIFGHKKGAATVAEMPPKDATIGILTIGGSADSDSRTAAAKAIAAAFEHSGRHAVIVNADAPSDSVCASNKTTSLVAAWLDTPANANAALRMIAYDCSGKIAYDHTFKEPLAGVSDAAVNAYLNPGKGRG
jgi:curli biogenesis system outer membrane secretion channel CsgG